MILGKTFEHEYLNEEQFLTSFRPEIVIDLAIKKFSRGEKENLYCVFVFNVGKDKLGTNPIKYIIMSFTKD